jgi:hypothetical protein
VFTVDQLRQFKKLAHDRPAAGRFEWMRHELVGVLGSGLYRKTSVLVEYRGMSVIWFIRDSHGHALLNIWMPPGAEEERLCVQENDFIVRGTPTDFEAPPSGRKLRVRYKNGDYLRIEFQEIQNLEAAIRRFVHVPPVDIKAVVDKWPITFVFITMNTLGAEIKFTPTMGRYSGFTEKPMSIMDDPIIFDFVKSKK